jgi:hypothetical protein
MWPAPLFLELAPAVLAVDALTVDADDADVVDTRCVASPDPLVTAAVAGAADADEGLDEPVIWAWTVALKVPVMPLRANLAENASAGNWELVESFRLRDVNLMK